MVVNTNKGEQFIFTSFTSVSKRDEALYLSLHLFEEPFTLVCEPPVTSTTSTPLNGVGLDYSIGGGGGTMNHPPQIHISPDTQPSSLVDTSTGQKALATAHRTQQVGAATLEELDRQGQVLDGMQRNLESTNAHLDRAERELRAIESVGGALANRLSRDPTRQSKLMMGNPNAGHAVPQSVPLPNPTVTVAIVWKHADDTLEPARMRMTQEGCEVESMLLPQDGETRKLLDKWLYDNVDYIKMRSRWLHLDIEFRDKRERVRMATALVQKVVNEMALRCSARGGRTLPVTFEKDSPTFPYGHEWIRERADVLAAPIGGNAGGAPLSPGSKRRTMDAANLFSVGGGGGNTRFTKESSVEHLLSPGADSGVRLALRIQDEQADHIADAVRTLGFMAEDIGVEVDRQTEQIKGINVQMDQTNARIQGTNQRVTRQLDKL